MEHKQALKTIEELRRAHAFIVERETDLANGRKAPAAEQAPRAHTHGMTR